METLGKYGLLEKLGDEILGPVYKAYDSSSHRNVTLITLGVDIPSDPALKEHFVAECAAILRLRHPNLATVYEEGEDRKVSYLAAEWLPGKDLKQLIAENAATTLEWKIAFMVQAAAGLAHAHTQGVLHRCLRPSNIHMLPDGTAKVSGFGCASIPTSPSTAHRTSVANIYQSPEQLIGREATAQSDIFSLGLIFYEFVTGVHPFHDADSDKTLDYILHQAQFPTVEQFPDLPFNLWPVLERCLAKEAEERYPSMQDFGLACQGMLEELAEDSECMRIELQTALPRLRKTAKRRDAPPSLAKLQSDIELVLFRVHDSDYQSLNRLILTLTEQHRLLDSPTEASSTCLPEPLEIPPEQGLPVELADNPSVEPYPGPQELAETAPRAPDTNGFLTTEGVSEPSAKTCPDGAQNAAAEPANESAAVEGSAVPAIEPTESRCSLAQAMTAESTPTSAVANVESSRPRTAPKDSFSELLRKIDQGQESTQKLVDSFLAGRQAMASGKPSPEYNGQDKPTAISPKQFSFVSNPEASPPARAAQTAAAQPQKPLSHTHTAGVQASPVENPLNAATQISAAPPKPAHRRTALWICASTVLLVLTFAIPGIRDRLITGIGKAVVQKGWRVIGRGKSAQTRTDDPMAIAVRNQLNFARRDILLEEAEILHAVGRRQEARAFLCRLLELYPDYAPAKEELDQIKAEISAPSGPDDQISPIQKLLGSASSAIKAGNLQKAKIDLDAAEQMEPGLPEVAKLRKSLEAKKTELAQSAARDQEAQLTANKQRDSEALALRAEELYRQGKYDDALAAVDEHMARYPTSTQIQEIRSRTVEIKQNLKSYETALSAGKLAEAQAAVEKIERINPADPGLAAMRKRAESAPVSGSASLSVYPIAGPAALVLDDQPVGTSGELVNQTISAGRHKLAARNANGQAVEMVHDFANGQAITLVYDVPGQVLRTMNESDRGRISKRKARLQAHRFAVEHSHGILRGSCKGDLIIDYYHVVFQPTSGSHGFSVSFKDLKLQIENKTAVLLFAAKGTEFFTFKLPDAPSAQMLRKLWDDLAALDM
jgi:serine/threonine protein kinase